MDDRVWPAVGKVKKQIEISPAPKLPLLWTEWNVPGMMNARDTIYVGPDLAHTVRECDGLVDMMSFWTFSDVFEEGVPITQPFEGHFGLRAKGGINKPSFYAFQLLHQLGNERLPNLSKDVLVTRTQTGGLAIAAWNLVPDQHGNERTFEFRFTGLPAGARVTIERVDADHGNVLKAYAAMGRPVDPTPAHGDRETALPAPKPTPLNDKVTLSLGDNELALLKVEK